MADSQADEADFLKPTDGHGFGRRGASGHAPPAFAGEGKYPRAPFGDAQRVQEVRDGLGSLALFQADASQLVPEPLVDPSQVAAAFGMPKVRHLTTVCGSLISPICGSSGISTPILSNRSCEIKSEDARYRKPEPRITLPKELP